jgi:hypothetical protein
MVDAPHSRYFYLITLITAANRKPLRIDAKLTSDISQPNRQNKRFQASCRALRRNALLGQFMSDLFPSAVVTLSYLVG